MSLSDDVKRELARVAATDDCDRLAELSGLFHSAGRLHLRGRGDVSLHLDVSESAVARRAFTLLRELGVDSEIRTYHRRAFDRATRYQLHVEGGAQALRVLHEAGVLGSRNAPLERPPLRVVRRAVLQARVPARRAAGRRLGERSSRTSSRDPRDGRRRSRLPRGRRTARAAPAAASSTADVTPSPMPREPRRSPTC